MDNLNSIEQREDIANIISKKHALNALYFGIFSIIAWIIPVVGVPFSLGAIFLGFYGFKSARKDFARSGISLGIIGLLLSIINLLVVNYFLSLGSFEELLNFSY